jgi:hypothetical protein
MTSIEEPEDEVWPLDVYQVGRCAVQGLPDSVERVDRPIVGPTSYRGCLKGQRSGHNLKHQAVRSSEQPRHSFAFPDLWPHQNIPSVLSRLRLCSSQRAGQVRRLQDKRSGTRLDRSRRGGLRRARTRLKVRGTCRVAARFLFGHEVVSSGACLVVRSEIVYV